MFGPLSQVLFSPFCGWLLPTRACIADMGSPEESPPPRADNTDGPASAACEFVHVGVEAHAAASMDGTSAATSTAISSPAAFRQQGAWGVNARQTTAVPGGAAEAARRAVQQGEALAAALTEAFADPSRSPQPGPMQVVSLTAEPSMFPSEAAAGVIVVTVEAADQAESFEVTAKKLVAAPDTAAAVELSDIPWLLDCLNRAASAILDNRP